MKQTVLKKKILQKIRKYKIIKAAYKSSLLFFDKQHIEHLSILVYNIYKTIYTEKEPS